MFILQNLRVRQYTQIRRAKLGLSADCNDLAKKIGIHSTALLNKEKD